MQSSGEQPLVGEEHCVTTLITAAKETIKEADMTENLSVTRERLVDVQQKTEYDPILQQLKETIELGLPITNPCILLLSR